MLKKSLAVDLPSPQSEINSTQWQLQSSCHYHFKVLSPLVFEIIRVGIWLEKQVILARPLNMIERRKSRKYFDGNVEWKTIGCVCFKMRVTMECLYVVRIMVKRRMLKIQRKEVFKKAWRWDLVPKRWLYQFLIGKKICPPLLMS